MFQIVFIVTNWIIFEAVDQSSTSLLDSSQSSQLSVVVPSKKDMHGELYKEVKVCSNWSNAFLNHHTLIGNGPGQPG